MYWYHMWAYRYMIQWTMARVRTCSAQQQKPVLVHAGESAVPTYQTPKVLATRENALIASHIDHCACHAHHHIRVVVAQIVGLSAPALHPSSFPRSSLDPPLILSILPPFRLHYRKWPAYSRANFLAAPPGTGPE